MTAPFTVITTLQESRNNVALALNSTHPNAKVVKSSLARNIGKGVRRIEVWMDVSGSDAKVWIVQHNKFGTNDWNWCIK